MCDINHSRLEGTVNEIDSESHRKPNPEYVKNLNQIEKEYFGSLQYRVGKLNLAAIR